MIHTIAISSSVIKLIYYSFGESPYNWRYERGVFPFLAKTRKKSFKPNYIGKSPFWTRDEMKRTNNASDNKLVLVLILSLKALLVNLCYSLMKEKNCPQVFFLLFVTWCSVLHTGQSSVKRSPTLDLKFKQKSRSLTLARKF